MVKRHNTEKEPIMFKSEIAFLVTFSVLVLSLMIFGLVMTQRATNNLQDQVDQWAETQSKASAMHKAKMAVRAATFEAQHQNNAARFARYEGAREGYSADNLAKAIANKMSRRK